MEKDFDSDAAEALSPIQVTKQVKICLICRSVLAQELASPLNSTEDTWIMHRWCKFFFSHFPCVSHFPFSSSCSSSPFLSSDYAMSMAWKPCLAYRANLEMVPCMVGNGIILAIMDDHCSNSFIHIWLMAHSFQLSGLSMGSYPLMISPFS